jgi:hypothetical protein
MIARRALAVLMLVVILAVAGVMAYRPWGNGSAIRDDSDGNKDQKPAGMPMKNIPMH